MAARRLKLRFRVGLMVLFVASLCLTALAPARQAYEQHQTIRAEEHKLAALRTSNARLDEQLTRLNDPDYLETMARDKLGLVRPGEISYIVEAPPPPPARPTAPPAPAPWYERALDWVAKTAGGMFSWIAGQANLN